MNQLHGLTGHEEAATTRRQPLKSAVWGSFTRNRPAAGGPATATCGECGQILRAGSSIGTSHLRRHTGTKRCQQRAAERRRQQLTAPPPGGGDQDDHPTSPPVSVEEPFFVVDGVDIPELLDDLIGKGLANIDEQSSGADQQFGADNCAYTLALLPHLALMIKFYSKRTLLICLPPQYLLLCRCRCCAPSSQLFN
jgi:hypothetical protein